MPETRVVVLISGEGRNLQAFIDGVQAGLIPARIVRVISNRADAHGLERARRAGIATEVIAHAACASREAFDAQLAAAVEAQRPQVVALAGFMRVLGDDFVHDFRGRLINIHPSLLPRYPGLRTHQRVLAAGDREHGATVHFVTEQLDGGPAIVQGKLSLTQQYTVESLAMRVMQEIELKIYPQALAWMARGQLRLERNVVWFRDRPLAQPLTLEDLEAPFQ